MLGYYKYIDKEIGTLLERVDDEDTVMVVSDHGAKKMDGGICFNEWLIQEGYLRVKNYPDKPTRMTFDMVDWSKTKAWGDGGYYGRLFINVEEKGMMIGEMSLIDMKPRSATVRAISEVTMIMLERGALADLFDKDPKILATISLNIARALSVRLRSSNEMFSEFFNNFTA